MADLQKASIEDLEQALQAKKDEHRNELLQRHRDLQSQVREIEAEIAALGGNAPGGRKTGPRPKNKMKLKPAIMELLKGEKKGLTKDEIAEGVVANGYATTSDNFGNIVYQTLHRNQETFKRGPAGRYTLGKTHG